MEYQICMLYIDAISVIEHETGNYACIGESGEDEVGASGSKVYCHLESSQDHMDKQSAIELDRKKSGELNTELHSGTKNQSCDSNVMNAECTSVHCETNSVSSLEIVDSSGIEMDEKCSEADSSKPTPPLAHLNIGLEEGARLSIVLQSLLSQSAVPFIRYVDIQQGIRCKGVFDKDGISIQFCGDGEAGYQLIVADVDRKTNMTMWTAKSLEEKVEKVNWNEWKENDIVDLNNTGSYWEGGVLNGWERCGYGKEYNDENNLVFEGFMLGDKKVCHGKEYRGIRGEKNGLVYEGGYVNSVRDGFGRLYNLNGELEYEGEWSDNHPLSGRTEKDLVWENGDDLVVPVLTEELTVSKGLYNDETLTTLHFPPLLNRLKKINIRSDCFKYVREFVVNGLGALKELEIAYSSFSISYEGREDGRCCITNCPKLRLLDIGYGSFADFKYFELSNVDSLQTLSIGERCFWDTTTCILKGE